MVSAAVRGTPRAVLDVLMHSSTNMTILGPVCEMEVLSSSSQGGGGTAQKEVGAGT